METRRDFLKAGAAALTVAATKPLFGVQGANDRIRMAVIGCGNRSGRVFDAFARQSNVQWVAGAEVNKLKLEGTSGGPAGFMTPARQTFKLDMVTDYRRILDRKDVDAVLIGTPDHWHHQQTIDAIAAGKDVYVEKPAANTIPRLNAMLDAYRKGKQIVQVGTQQRSWDHFIEAKKVLDSGILGNITHIYIVQPGSYARPKEAEQPVPATLDWDMWQGPAPKRPYKPSRLGFRAWYEYGGGLVADWGAHHVDVAHWFMNADNQVPIKTAATGAFLTVPDADPEQVAGHVLDFVAVRQVPHDVRQWRSAARTGRSRRMGRVLRQSEPRNAAGESHGLGGSAARAAHTTQAGTTAASNRWRQEPVGRRRAGRSAWRRPRRRRSWWWWRRERARRRTWLRSAAGRIQGVPEPERRRRGGLSARRPRAELPRLHAVAAEAGGRHGDRLSRRPALPDRARSAAAGEDARVGSCGSEDKAEGVQSSEVQRFGFRGSNVHGFEFTVQAVQRTLCTA